MDGDDSAFQLTAEELEGVQGGDEDEVNSFEQASSRTNPNPNPNPNLNSFDQAFSRMTSNPNPNPNPNQAFSRMTFETESKQSKKKFSRQML